MATEALAAARLALSLSAAQRRMVANTLLDGGDDARTAGALATRGLYGAGLGGYVDSVGYDRRSRYVPGVRTRTALGARVARLLWGDFASKPHIVRIIADRLAA